MTTPPPINPAVALAWGLADGGRRGPKPSLSLADIVDSAVSIADDEGLEAVSMARVAKSLGFTTMSLYRYVASKEELLAHMQDAALGPLPADRVSAGRVSADRLSAAADQTAHSDWRSGLAAWTQAVLHQFRLHPWSVDIPVAGPPLMPRNIEWLDWCLGYLEGTPLAPLEKLSAVLLLSGYAQNEVSREAALRTGRGGHEPDANEGVDYEAALRHLVDPARLPALSAVLDEGLFTPPPNDTTADGDSFMLDFGLHRILDGIERLMDSRSG
ncbi:TetR/AcrR family transcriptional regulator [Brevibacterium jeotgali]|uniref:Transcriptional regulator, TetR family n=1 Tax=Brevibacterium jeotgali TaxID=1262550 RepID=A0A2H1L884_9MICO|nr:TetR/AcrR family transcriptional regulator [Brevibacterium jeotgali]TWC01598.1 TetR family transcriptional regulator [Brevibacterium jeotgali]SMY13089.1 transcriptional regulator, TetR family [Brevibacterium jeotgali]